MTVSDTNRHSVFFLNTVGLFMSKTCFLLLIIKSDKVIYSFSANILSTRSYLGTGKNGWQSKCGN